MSEIVEYCGERFVKTAVKFDNRQFNVLKVAANGEMEIFENLKIAAAKQGCNRNIPARLRKAISIINDVCYDGEWYVEEKAVQPAVKKEVLRGSALLNQLSDIKFPQRPRLEINDDDIAAAAATLELEYKIRLNEIPELYRYDPVPQKKRGIVRPDRFMAEALARQRLLEAYRSKPLDGLYVYDAVDGTKYQFDNIEYAARVLQVVMKVDADMIRGYHLGDHVIEVKGVEAGKAWKRLMERLDELTK